MRKKKDSFRLCKKAHIGYRYNEEYSITLPGVQKIKVMISSLKDEMNNGTKA